MVRRASLRYLSIVSTVPGFDILWSIVQWSTRLSSLRFTYFGALVVEKVEPSYIITGEAGISRDPKTVTLSKPQT
jgi:hypothetical protein